MKRNIIFGCVVGMGMVGGSAPAMAAPASPTTQGAQAEDVKVAGAFGFPQGQAEVLCDTPDLRLSVWNNGQYLYVQAVLWGDSDASGEKRIPDGRTFSDQSAVSIDVDADGKATIDVDRTYYVNPLVTMPGLHYVVAKGAHGMTSGLRDDSAGRGSVRYVTHADGSKFRVDNFLIPLAEIHRVPGDKIRLAYWGMSLRPNLELNSLGIAGKKHLFQLPLEKYHTLTLSDRTAKLDPLKVPEDRKGKASGEK